MEYDEYHDAIDRNEREIAHWQQRTTETEKIALELAMCVDVVNKMSQLWENADPEDKRGMAHNLFEYLVYDLDTRRIVDFRFKPWADRFLILRASLYDEESDSDSGDSSPEKDSPHAPHGVRTDMPHRGLGDRSVFEQLAYAARRMILENYTGMLFPKAPINRITPTKCERNDEIRRRHQQGETLISLAEAFDLSENRVWQIVHHRRE